MYGYDRSAHIFRFLFRMATLGHRLGVDVFLERLVVGIANRYGAASCSLCRFGTKRKTVWASAGPPLLGLSGTERVYLHTLNGRLVQHAADTGAVVSALDLDVDGDVNDFLDDLLPHMDIFAFPLVAHESVEGVLVLYLPVGSTPLGDTDIQALLSVAEVLGVADRFGPTAREPASMVRVPPPTLVPLPRARAFASQPAVTRRHGSIGVLATH